MDAEGLKELFSPIGPVRLKRMFSGHSIFLDEMCFALALRGEVFLKVDADTKEVFAAAGSRPFSYEKSGRKVVVGYWLLPESAFDDAEELRRWCDLAFDAARRAAARKQGRPPARRRVAKARAEG